MSNQRYHERPDDWGERQGGQNPAAASHLGDSESLRIYYRQLTNNEPMTSAEERAVWKKVDEIIERMRERLYTFLFILETHGQLLADGSPSSVSDAFPASSFPDMASEKEMQYLKSYLEPWRDRILALADEIRTVYQTDGPNSIGLIPLRKKSVDLLMEYPVSRKKMMEWYSAVKNFRSSYFSTGDDLFAETRQTLERKTGMLLEDFLSDMNMLDADFELLEEYRQQIVTRNLRLVVSIVQHHRRSDIQTADIIQEGNLGLIRAFDTFDYKLGYRFSTYATWWIKQAVTRAISSQSRIIRLPAHMIAAIVKIGKTEQAFLQRNGKMPTDDELADELEMPRERISAIKKMSRQTVSLQAPMNMDEQENSQLKNFLTDNSSETTLHQMTSEHLMIRLKKAIETLNEREQLIIRMRYGLDNMPQKTLQELSEMFHLTRERIRQIELRAIEKLRDPSLRTCFQDYFFLH